MDHPSDPAPRQMGCVEGAENRDHADGYGVLGGGQVMSSSTGRNPPPANTASNGQSPHTVVNTRRPWGTAG